MQQDLRLYTGFRMVGGDNLGGAAVAGLAVVARVPFLGVVLGGTATAAMIRLLGG